MSTNKAIAEQILNTATSLGWKIAVRNDVLTITKSIEPDNNTEFCNADSEYYSILGLLPNTSAGSTWGTDGGGIGALSAIKQGVFRMNKSGGSKRVLSALAKMI